MLIKNNKWKFNILLTISTFVIIIIFEVYPRINNIISLGYDIYERRIKAEEAELNNNIESKLIRENRNLKFSINSLVSNYEEGRKISSIITFLDEIASKNDVVIADIIPGKVEEKDNLWLQTIEVNICSDYEGSLNFVRSLERSSRVILLKELDFNPVRPMRDSLNIKVNLEVYLNL